MFFAQMLIGIMLLQIICRYVYTKNTFVVELQSSGKWSKDEVIKYQGKLPNLKEFTSCHWEKDKYFPTDSTNIWGYCYKKYQNDSKMKCVQFYYQGNSSTANRDILLSAWFQGFTERPIDIRVPVYSFRHRTWNHFCWAYSSITGHNSFFYNGILVSNERMRTKERINYPVISGTEHVYKSLFVIGQEPDSLDGLFREDQALFGSVAEFNLWDHIIEPSIINDMASCNKVVKGNIIAWEKENFDIPRSLRKEVHNITQLCEKDNALVLFSERQTKEAAHDTCTSHGGYLVVPKSELEHEKIFNMVTKYHSKKCMPKRRANFNANKLIWLGLESRNNEWFEQSNSLNSTPIQYNKWAVDSWDRSCAFITSDGFWGDAGDECNDITLCFICSIPKSTVFTLKNICQKGSVFQWNYGVNGCGIFSTVIFYKV